MDGPGPTPQPSGALPRIAWLGPAPKEIGGVPAMAGQIVLGLAEAGAEVEMFLEGSSDGRGGPAFAHPGVAAHFADTSWEFDRWYSSTNFTKLATGTGARVLSQRRLVETLVARHRGRPFDVLYRFSQLELFRLRGNLDRLPPLVVHPEVHAQGERVHHWRERALARQTEPVAQFLANHAYLRYRAGIQRRDAQIPVRVIVPSRRFAKYLHDDYTVPMERMRVLPNIIDLLRFTPAPAPPPPVPVRLLLFSRMAVRKGVEQVVRLSHRLDDLAGQVQIDCYGGPSLFSNYLSLLDNLNPRVAAYRGICPAPEAPDLFRQAHGLIQPSWYEPFALSVAEALASGLPVAVSDEVGAGESIDARVCRVHATGDLDAFERNVRALVAELRAGGGADLASEARAEAEAHFDRAQFARGFLEIAEELR